MASVTASDALLFTVARRLQNLPNRPWGKVYQRNAPEKAPANANVWVVVRILSAGIDNMRADRDSYRADLAVQAITLGTSDLAEKAANVISDSLHLSGENDTRRDIFLPNHDDWRFLCVKRTRELRAITPVRQGKGRFYENGFVFDVRIEARHPY